MVAAGAADYTGPRKSTVVDGSRSKANHLVPLLAENWEQILPTDDPAKPFSSKMTCGDCHNYLTVSGGWHFNSSTGMAESGRPGEPWVLADDWTGTQLPISYREWPGVYKPEDVGMTQWEFVKRFGRHMPGGDMGDNMQDPPDTEARWGVSGRVDINCLGCHNAAPEQNPTEWAIQMARENFRWAATAASGLAVVENTAANLPWYFDPLNDVNLDENVWSTPPKTSYAPDRFDAKFNVFFDVTKNPPAERCYFCHSAAPANVDEETFWRHDQDVHLAAGLTCTDCHRNGVGHDIVRGYEGEDPATAELTCAGCHLGDENGLGGRMGAPRPAHRNLPPVHLENIACTACHSTPANGFETERVKFSRANRMGIHGAARWDTEVPFIQAPVFVRNDTGKVEPRAMMWPAFWGVMNGNDVKPLPIEVATAGVDEIRFQIEKAEAEAAAEAAAAEEAAREAAEKAAREKGETLPEEPAAEEEIEDPEPEPPAMADPLTEEQIGRVLAELAKSVEGDPVYVAGGMVHKLNGEKLASLENPVAEAVSWPLAHNVLPAAESLGANGCTDCHADDAPFFFTTLAAAAPMPVGKPAAMAMHQLQEVDAAFLESVELGVLLRYVFLAVSLALAVVFALALAHYGYIGLEGLARVVVSTNSRQKR